MNKTHNIPLYVEIKETLLKEINHGKYKNEKMLPSEKELAEEFHVSRVTIRKALDELRNEDFITSKAGFGTSINHDRTDLKKFTMIKSFTSEMQESGTRVETMTSTLSIVFADEKLVPLFNCNLYDRIYNLKRLRGTPEKPVVYSDTWLNLKKVELPTTKEFLYGSLYGFLITNNILFSRFEEEVEAIMPSDSLKDTLKLDKESVILKRIRKGFDREDNLVEYTVNYYDSKHYKYNIEVQSTER